MENSFHGTCSSCDMIMGEWCGGHKLEWKKIEDCCVCFEKNVTGVSIPWCSHFICEGCFKQMFKCLSDEWQAGEPESDDEYEATEALLRCPLCRAGRRADATVAIAVRAAIESTL